MNDRPLPVLWRLTIEKGNSNTIDICGQEAILRAAVEEWEKWLAMNEVEQNEAGPVLTIEAVQDSYSRAPVTVKCLKGSISSLALARIS